MYVCVYNTSHMQYMRKHKNRLHALLDSEGTYVYDQQGLISQALSYYATLFNGQALSFPPLIHPVELINKYQKHTHTHMLYISWLQKLQI